MHKTHPIIYYMTITAYSTLIFLSQLSCFCNDPILLQTGCSKYGYSKRWSQPDQTGLQQCILNVSSDFVHFPEWFFQLASPLSLSLCKVGAAKILEFIVQWYSTYAIPIKSLLATISSEKTLSITPGHKSATTKALTAVILWPSRYKHLSVSEEAMLGVSWTDCDDEQDNTTSLEELAVATSWNPNRTYACLQLVFPPAPVSEEHLVHPCPSKILISILCELL